MILMPVIKMDKFDYIHILNQLMQIRNRNNGISKEVNKKEFLETKSLEINGGYFSFDYIREKTSVSDSLIENLMEFIRTSYVENPPDLKTSEQKPELSDNR